MTLCRTARPALYKSRTTLQNRRARLACGGGLTGPITAYPLLSRCAVQLEGPGQTQDSWLYALRVPVTLLGKSGCAQGQLVLHAALCAPLREEELRTLGQLQLDISFDELWAAPVPGGCELHYTANISLYLTV